MKFNKILLLTLFFCGLFSQSRASVQVKGAGNIAEKVLVHSWKLCYSAAQLNYDSKNTADAINQFLGKGCDYALVDTPLTEAQEKKAKNHPLLFIPLFLSAQAVVYNLPGIPSGVLKLTPEILSDIFWGKIKKWNDPILQKINSHVRLPDLNILVVHQSNESSRNDFFPAFLTQQNPLWILKRENDKDLHWRVGQNVNGDNNVFQKLRQWAGGIAVMDFSFVQEKHLPVARIQNPSGRFVAPVRQTIEEAFSRTKNLTPTSWILPGATRLHQAYPFANVVWAVVYQDYETVYHQPKRSQALVNFLNWVLSFQGQSIVSENYFVPLPEKFLSQAQSTVGLIQH